MRNIPPKLKEKLNSGITSFTTCWRLILKDKTRYCFTSHQHDLNIDDEIYLASTGFSSSAIASNNSLAVDNTEFEGILNSDSISEQDIVAGKIDHAEVEVFLVDYQHIDLGKIILKRGWLGEVRLKKNKFFAEIRGLTQKLAQNIGEVYTPSCRANFCDKKCKLNIENYKFHSVIISSINRSNFYTALQHKIADYFNNGIINFISGQNKNIAIEVRDFYQGNIITKFPLPYDVAPGDEFEIIAGCDKSFSSCAQRFDNAVNFRGEPHLPGLDNLFNLVS